MIPEVVLISKINIDWPTLRKNIFVATGQSPSNLVAQCPVKLSEAAECLVFAAYLKYDFLAKTDPLQILRTLPRECMSFLHYTFLIACDEDTTYMLRDTTSLTITANKGDCLLVTGPLTDWFDAIWINLIHDIDFGFRLLLDKLLLLLEKEGLGELFSKFNKKSLPDKTFVLEHK